MKRLLVFVGTAILLFTTVYGQRIEDKIETNADGSVTMTAIVHVLQGNPQPTSFTWTLPDGTVLNSGDTHESFETRAGAVFGRYTLALTAKKGHQSFRQVFVFKVEASTWRSQFTFTLEPSTTVNNQPGTKKFSTLVTDTSSNSDGSYSLYVTVSGGSPPPNKFQWTLPGGETLSPGRTSGSFRANWPRFNSDGSSTYRLDLLNGLTSFSQHVTFRVEATGSLGWWRTTTFNLPTKSSTVASRRGSVGGSWRVDSQRKITINAVIRDGTPAANTYLWTVQNPDGSFTNYQPGSGPASAIGTNSAGNPTATLTITSLATRSRRFTLRVSSVVNGQERWWARAWWDIGATA